MQARVAVGIGAWLLCAVAGSAADDSVQNETAFQMRVRAVDLLPTHHPVLAESDDLHGGEYAEFSGEWALPGSWSTELAVAGPSSFGLSDGNAIRLWPVTWTAKYEVAALSYFHPYLGVGAHYTHSSLEKAVPADRADIGSSSVGWVAQAGIDGRFTANWSANLDVRYLGNLEPRSLSNGVSFPPAGVYRIDPMLIGIGVAYRWEWSH